MPTRKRTRRVIDRFIADQGNEVRTLDVGCSRSPYREHFPNRVGVDLRPGKHIEVAGDIGALPIASEAFEQVLLTEVLEHVADPPRGLRELHRVLRPGGRLIICVPFIYPIHDAPVDFHRWTHHGLRGLLADAGFEIEFLRHDFGTLETISLLLHRVGLQATRSAWDPRRWVLGALSGLVRVCAWMPLREFGDTKGRHPEEAILSMRYMILARRPIGGEASGA